MGSALTHSLSFPKVLQETYLVRRVNGAPTNNAPKEVTAPHPPIKPKPEDISDHPPHRGGDHVGSPDKEYLDTIRHQPEYEKGYDYWHGGNRPEKGETGLYKDEEKHVLDIYYGRQTKWHGMHVAYHAKANGLDENKAIRLEKASEEKKNQQRHDSLRYLKKRGPGIVVDEKPPASANHDGWWHTVVEVPDGESTFESQMFKRFDDAHEKDPSYTVMYVDHRDDATKAEMQHDLDSDTIRILLGPKVDGYPEPVYVTKDFTTGIKNDGDKKRTHSQTIVDSKRRKDHNGNPQKRDMLQPIQSHEGDYQDPSDG